MKHRLFERKSFDAKNVGLLACKDRRLLPLDLADLKFDDKGADKPLEFEGYASVWGRVDSYGDTVIKGAFESSLKERRPMMLFGHSPGRVPGKWIKYQEDDKGLLVRGQLTPGHSEAQDIGASLKHGSLNGLSIGGYTTDWESQKSGGRVIKAFDLYEISVVSMPAEQEARIDTSSVKSMLDECDRLADFEALLCETGGFSKKGAQIVVSRFARIVRGEPGDGEAIDKSASELLELLKTTTLPTLESIT